MDRPTNSPISQAFQAEPALNVPTSIGEVTVGPRAEPYADWDDFRTNSPTVQQALADLATRALPDLRNAECLPLPADLPNDTGELGLPVASVVMPGDSRRFSFVDLLAIIVGIAVVLVMLLLRFLGITLSPFTERLLLATGFVAGSVLFALWLYLRTRKSHLTCWIMNGGIICRQNGRIDFANWRDVRSLEISAGGLNVRCRVDIGIDTPIVLDTSSDPKLMPIIEYIEKNATAAQLLPRLHAILLAGGADFGPVQLDRTGMRTPFDYPPWATIRKVVADETKLLIDLQDHSTWLEVALASVSFPLLVQVLSHIMIAEHQWLPKHETQTTEAKP